MASNDLRLSQTSQKVEAIVPALLKWFSENARDLPWRRICDPYAIYVSEIMLQQTQVITVIPYWERWMRALPDVKSLACADPQTVLKLWEGLGYYSRARNAQAAARVIVENLGGEFPNTLEGLLELPGVGRYTAGAICSIAFNQPVPILDGNVARVLCRVFGIGGDVKSKPVNAQLWKKASEMVEAAHKMPDRRLAGVSDCLLQIAENFPSSTLSKQTGAKFAGNCSSLNQSMMELGALVCTPKDPACGQCPLAQFCFAHQSNRVADFPKPALRATVTHRKYIAFLVSRNGKYLVRQRAKNVVNASLWELPNIEQAHGGALTTALCAPFQITAAEPLLRVKHSITRYRIELEFYDAKLKRGVKAPGEWFSLDELKELPFTSAHRKIIEMLDRAGN